MLQAYKSETSIPVAPLLTRVQLQSHSLISDRLRFTTKADKPFLDITESVREVIRHHNFESGLVVVFSQHTTAALRINESERYLERDFIRFLSRIAPRKARYLHNDIARRRQEDANIPEDEAPNGHSHCAHLLLSSSEVLPVVGGELVLGRWQRLFLIELDRARHRELLVQMMGVVKG